MRAEPFPGIPEVTVERGVPCRLRDGVTLAADVYRPAGDRVRPALLFLLLVRGGVVLPIVGYVGYD